MTTVISSATREVGDRLRPARSRSSASGSIRRVASSSPRRCAVGDFSRVERDAIAQVVAGAHVLDVNAGIPMADEPAILARTIQLVQSLVDVPLSIDSSIVEALAAGLAVYRGKAARQLGDRRGGPAGARAAARAGATARRSSRSATTTPGSPRIPTSGSPSRRRSWSAPRTTASRARTSSSTRSSCRSARWQAPAGRCSRSSAALRDELHVNTICGASNISFGLPESRGHQRPVPRDGDRQRADLARSPTRCWPTSGEAIMAADVLMGNDAECGRWIRAHREPGSRRRGAQARPARQPRRTAPGPDASPSGVTSAAGTV